MKTTSASDRLWYLNQHTIDQPKPSLVVFLQMDHKERREYNCGNSYTTASAHINKALSWPLIRPWMAMVCMLFLNAAASTLKDTDGLDELESSSSLRLIVSTLPFRLPDKWPTHV